MVELPRLAAGREVTGHWESATRGEWLVTDGTGSYATGTVAQARTRRYHGHLIAALAPPLGRTLLVGGMAEGVSAAGGPREWLHSQEWAGGAVDPRGHELCEEFALDGTLPVWRYALCGGAILEKRVFMPALSQTTVVTYSAIASPGGRLQLDLSPLLAWRDHHATFHETRDPAVVAAPGGITVRFKQGGEVWLRASAGEWTQGVSWYRRFLLAQEWERGLDAIEDLVAPACLHVDLGAGETVALTMRARAGGDPTGLAPGDWAALLEAERERQSALLAAAALDAEPSWIRRLVLAADAFVVGRDAGPTLIAGYPWFGDWGRDAMIALPGVALSTGRPEVARGLLRTFAAHVDQGMIPNRFPEAGEVPEYNTVDASLWYVEALRAHVEGTGDESLVDELWPMLEEMVRWHIFGTRFGIGVDPADGLLRAGQPGVQVTWMDARVDGWVVTPRTGKPVEVNALWYNALRSLEAWAQTRSSRHDCGAAARRVAAGFDRFWDARAGRLLDVIDGPDGADAKGADDRAMRCNQVLAVSLHHSPLSADRAAAVLDSCLHDLRTSLGVRTLAPDEPGYRGAYSGDVRERDAAYHQGTAWPWLLGPLALAHLRVHGDPQAARRLLAPLEHHLGDAGLGSISEIADGDPPHLPRGCPWQAWSVAETLRAWCLARAASSP